MPMKTIKNAKKGNISFLAGGNYESIYSSILKVVGKDAPFAPLIITTTSIAWLSNGKERYVSIVDAPSEIQGVLGLMWEQLKNELRPRLHDQKMDYILEIPDLTYVFYTETECTEDGSVNNRYKLLITGWACHYSNTRDSEGEDSLQKHIFEAAAKHQNVVVKVLNADNTPLVDACFVYKYENLSSQEITSNESGVINQGLCVVGATLSFTYKHTGQTRTLTVQKNIEEYTLVFAPMVKLTLSVFDQHDSPLQTHDVTIEYGRKRYNVQTDGLGVIIIDDLLYADPALQLMVNINGFQTEYFSVSYPETNITMKVDVPEKQLPYLVVMRDGQVISNYSVRFTGAVVGVFCSDEEGKISLDVRHEGESFAAESASEDCKHEYVIIKDQKIYEFNLPAEIKEPLSFACYLKVVRGDGQIPVPNHFVKISGESFNAEKFTDKFGIVTLGNLCSGDTLCVSIDGEESPIQIVIEENKSEYLVCLSDDAKIVSCHLKVIGGDDMSPVSNYRLGIHSESINGMYTTDESGIIPLSNMKVGDTVEVYLSETDLPEEFSIVENKEEYIIYLRKPDIIQSAYIKVVRGGELVPVPNYTLKIDSETMQGFYQTDDSGKVLLGEQKPGCHFICFTDLNNPPEDFFIIQGQEEYLIKIDDTSVVNKGDIVVTLLVKDKVTPVHPATITLINSRKESFTGENDSAGSVIVPRSFFIDDEKIRINTVTPKYKVRSTRFKYNDDQDHYIIHLTHPFNWKLLLWLLLPIALFVLCLINFTKDITVHAENQNGNNMSGAVVNLDYEEHALYKNSEFFYMKTHHLTGITDDEGNYTFEDVPCSVYSYIFYCFNKATITVSSNMQPVSGVQSVNHLSIDQSLSGHDGQSNIPTTKKFMFHWNRKVTVVVYEEPKPEIVDLMFRTLDAETMSELPDCSLQIITTKSNVSSPINSGRGRFLVQGLYLDESITIVASKSGYGVNDVTVRDILVSELLAADQSKRDIPLKEDMLPCNAGESGLDNVDAYTVSVPQSYNMGTVSGTFEIIYETGNACEDCIDLYNHNPGENYTDGVKVFSSGMVTTNGLERATVRFSYGSVITAVVTTGSSSGSMWSYRLSCPK